jgi:hypothetical protein
VFSELCAIIEVYPGVQYVYLTLNVPGASIEPAIGVKYIYYPLIIG